MISVSEEDACKAVVDLCFVKGDDCDALLVATEHPAGGRVELWELKEIVHTTHKIFNTASSDNGSPTSPKITMPVWKYDEVFTGPPSQVVSLSTPLSTLQTGTGSPCYVAAAYADGSIQCLLRDSLQHIGSVELPKTGNILDDPTPAKKSRSSAVEICSLSFTATGNALVAIDSLGQIYLYRMSPISDPGGPHTVPYLVTMFEYCLASGIDFWDLTICAKLSHIDTLCEKLTENFDLQPPHIRSFYYGRFMAIKSSLFRLGHGGEQRSADCYALYMLNSINGAFRSLIRSSEASGSISEKNTIYYDRLLSKMIFNGENCSAIFIYSFHQNC
jgi:mediator of RNA polymerase II transcription subunit 16